MVCSRYFGQCQVGGEIHCGLFSLRSLVVPESFSTSRCICWICFPVRPLVKNIRWIRSVAVSPDGRRIATGSEDRTAKVWDAATGRELLTLAGHTAGIASVAFS